MSMIQVNTNRCCANPKNKMKKLRHYCTQSVLKQCINEVFCIALLCVFENNPKRL